MKIMKAIEAADALCPNPYTLEEKIRWCDEVNADIRRNILKKYDVIETQTDSSGELQLPLDIPSERVEVVYSNGQAMTKQDFRSFMQNYTDDGIKFGGQNKIKVVYLTMPERIRFPDIRGEFNTGDNYIEIMLPPFKEGDMIELCQGYTSEEDIDWSKAKTAYVAESYVDKIMLDKEILTPETGAKLAIRRIVDDETEIDEAPYDSMYIEYLLAKAALYQHDYPSYNAHMSQYQVLFGTMRRDMKTRCPLNAQVRFKNYSIV